MALCEGCAQPAAPLRRCTRQYLCAPCRRLPQFKLVSLPEVRRQTGLTSNDLLPLRAGTIPNSSDRRFARTAVYLWVDVALLCLERGIAFE